MVTMYRQRRRTLRASRWALAWEYIREAIAAVCCIGMMFGGVLIAGWLA